MVKKIKKAKHLLTSNLHQKKSLQALQNFNATTRRILKIFNRVKTKEFDEDEIELFNHLESYRDQLLKSDEIISYEFFDSDRTDTVAQICEKAASPKIWCQFLHLLIKEVKAANVLEIGTNLGISGQYYLSAMPDQPYHNFITLEGIPRLCEISEKRFSELGLSIENEVIQGDFNETLPFVVNKDLDFNFVFIDGNHQYEPTLSYFNQLKSTYAKNAILVFDDIYWTPDMEKAWKEIKEDPGVACSIDFFKAGIIIYNPDLKKKKLHVELFLSRD